MKKFELKNSSSQETVIDLSSVDFPVGKVDTVVLPATIDLSGVDFPVGKVDTVIVPETLVGLSGVIFPENKRIDAINLSL